MINKQIIIRIETKNGNAPLICDRDNLMEKEKSQQMLL